MDDRALPPLSGLCLHEPSDDEYAPDATSGGPDHKGTRAIGRSDGNYQTRLLEWKNRTESFGPQGRWETSKTLDEEEHTVTQGRFPYYFQNNPTFYQDWVPIAQHEGLCKTAYFGIEGGGQSLMFPPHFLMRLISDSLNGQRDVPRASKPFILVDGANMFEPRHQFFEKWKEKIQDPPQDRIVICFLKTDTLQRRLFAGTTANDYAREFGGDQQAYDRFKRIRTMLRRLTSNENQIFLVQMEPWQPAKNPQARDRGGCILDPKEEERTRWGQNPDEEGVLQRGFAHLWCEFDDVLMEATRKYIDYFGMEAQTLTGDGRPKKPLEMYQAFHRFLEYNDIFLMRVFQTTNGFLNCYDNIRNTFPRRYSHSFDYIVPGQWPDKPLSKLIGLEDVDSVDWRLFVGRDDVQLRNDSGGQAAPEPSFNPGTWFSNQVYPVPPGWDPEDLRYYGDGGIVHRLNATRNKVDYETLWEKWRRDQISLYTEAREACAAPRACLQLPAASPGSGGAGPSSDRPPSRSGGAGPSSDNAPIRSDSKGGSAEENEAKADAIQQTIQMNDEERNAKINAAKRAFAQFYNRRESTVTLDELESSSAGVDVWATYAKSLPPPSSRSGKSRAEASANWRN